MGGGGAESVHPNTIQRWPFAANFPKEKHRYGKSIKPKEDKGGNYYITNTVIFGTFLVHFWLILCTLILFNHLQNCT